MVEKPIIRHCKNCPFGECAWINDAYCTVKYKYIKNGRITALFCKYYKQKEENYGKEQ